MNYDILRGSSLIATVSPSGSIERAIMGPNIANMTFELSSLIHFRVGDHVVIQGQNYYINTEPDVKKESSIKFIYSLKLEVVLYDLIRSKYFFYNSENVLTKSEFSLMGNAETFIDLLLLNVARRQTGWIKGTVDVTDTRMLTFNNENCLTVLSRLAEEFKTEFWIEGQTIHLTKRGNLVPLELQYGRGNGLYNIERIQQQDKQLVTVLYAEGGEKNIPADYRGFSSRLRLPSPLLFLERNVSQYGAREDTIVFPEIYPKRIGIVTAVGDEFTFTDTGIDFDLNLQLIDKVSAKVEFQTGYLAGNKFEIEAGSFDYSSKTMRLLVNQERDLVMPSSAFKPAVGDKYIISDIIMPNAYILAAELELQTAAQNYLNLNSDARKIYQVTCDNILFKQYNYSLTLGSYITLTDDDFGFSDAIRVLGFSQDLQDPSKITNLNLSEQVEINRYTKQANAQENIEKAIRQSRLFDVNRARLNWRTSQELKNLVFDPDGYYFSESIKPLSIETTMISVAAKSQQFVLSEIIFQPNYLGDSAKFRSSAGKLDHFSISEEIKTWNISAFSSDTLAPATAYYIYAKCSKVGIAGTIVLSISQMTVDQDPTDYYFLIGVVHSPVGSVRGISLTYGQTAINGKFITTGAIFSTDGLTYFDLDAGVIGGKIAFASGTTGYDNIADKPDLSSYIDAEYVDLLIADLQDQIDGQLISFFEQHDPTTSNAPAIDWTTPELKAQHANDTFTNTDTGASWRWVLVSGVWGWVPIADTATEQALALAGEALDTADGKRRVFVATPTTPYDVGDLWVQGFSGDIMRCQTARTSGIYMAGDWIKASKYTDDTVAEAAVLAAGNAAAAAGIANAQLADIANDGKLTPGEKHATKGEFDSITAEKAAIEAQADNYLITTEKTAYTTAYNTLYTYLGTLNLSTSGTETITAADFRAKFADYYEKRQLLLKALADKAKLIADNAGTAAAAAASSAATANALLADIANDAKLTPVEKKAVKKEWEIIQAEKPTIDGQATVYSITTEKTAYDTAYDALDAYISPKLTSLTTTETIVSADFRAAFKNYYDKKVLLLKKISDLADGRINTAQASAANAIADALAAYNAAGGVASDLSDLSGSLGGLAFEDLIGAAQLDSTIIDGGYIKTTLIDAEWIKSTVITTDYISGLDLDFVTGTIGGWTIEASALTAESVIKDGVVISGNPHVLIRGYIEYQNSGGTVIGYQEAAFGNELEDHISGDLNSELARLINHRPYITSSGSPSQNHALYLSAKGADNNFALETNGGRIQISATEIGDYIQLSSPDIYLNPGTLHIGVDTGYSGIVFTSSNPTLNFTKGILVGVS
ncbi:hypothetical protein [Hufsiella ginkgonis]|uniref:Prophage tail endopeptidase domain-containing protein n=1 Tax=Hufsiella ginkgonis TaxID=2695274 RepID=A0A7K1Y0U5_9SPHI|nr:hypothetical protein [Hufsiella ginkgonis]MXV16822.1 hypothetical protein [Hufsiella ginkgonis]